ncbi:DUF4124 domain-containing protein [Noviherbaspirillum galbum]|uniref:DUF4124 domain-containing protein n=1 Tax=Noviherbaspirillum galbum TaxID=2709383 RepID=A0A6B3SZT4_9BURK|nr:DUF4124 domain-containing protein [Noviherbaspirillum galbum]NEX64579.1 DUF4124 domain-containing protein [Noviherbaspirillum galbum]
MMKNQSQIVQSALILIVCASNTSHAQQTNVYKWTDEKGKVTYSDVPPPASLANPVSINTRSMRTQGLGGPELPYDLALAVRTNPVTLLVPARCATCDESRRLLSDRGVPYTEKPVVDSNGADQPELQVGKRELRGFDKATWNQALTSAGYPATNKLPKDYKLARTESGTEAQEEPARVAKPYKIGPTKTAPTEPIGNVPPGFRF